MKARPSPCLTGVQARILHTMLSEEAKSAGNVRALTGMRLGAVRKELTSLTGLLISQGEDALAAGEGRQP